MFKSLSSLRLLAGSLIGVSVIAALVWFAVPRPPGAEATALYSPLGAPLSIFDALIALSGALLFFLTLKNFRPELKPAYRLIAIAQLVIGLGAMLFPYVEYYNLWVTYPILTLLTYAGYFFGSILMYLGARKFHIILGFRSKLASVWVAVGLTLLAWGLHAFLPHAPVGAEQGLNEAGYDAFEIVSTLPLVFYGAALYLVWRLYQQTGSGYRKIFTWLSIGIELQLLAALNTAILEVIGYHNWYFASRVYIIPAILADIGIFWAAYQFNAFGKVHKRPQSKGGVQDVVTSMDIIVYLAGSVADKAQIDAYLDGMREVTSRLHAGQAPDDAQQQELLAVYLQIEELLLTKDKLRAFDRQDLRNDLNQRFDLDSRGGATFWPLLEKKTV